MTTVEIDKVEGLIGRLKSDRGFREEVARDPFSALLAAGIELPESILSSEARVLGEGDSMSVYFQTTVTGLKWPYRYYYLENQSDRDLNLESWRHIAGIGSQEHAVKAEPGKTVAFGLATLEELLWNQCNLSNNSHLVRDLKTNKVLGEAYNVTCGKTVNYWTATGSGDDITVTLKHVEQP
jgi:hypothetical protein